MENKENESAEKTIGIWMTMGICYGVAFGAAFGNPGIGISLGMVAGIIIGNMLSTRPKENLNEEDESAK